MRILLTLVFLSLGLLMGVFLSPYLHIVNTRIILGAGIFLIIFIAYLAVRTFVVNQRKVIKTPGDGKQKSQVGFVVDTFQELVGKLKEKEKELEKLRALAEDRAVRMETYNENILHSVPSGVISIDNSMRIKSINQSAERILGFKSEDVINKDYKEIFSEPLVSSLTDGNILRRAEYPYVTKDNRHIWLGVAISQLRNASNEVIGLIIVFTDLTEVKALQGQVELKKRLTQLGEMSAGIAHELRNPLSVIAGYAKLLHKKVDPSNEATVNAILAEIETIDKIISEFLAFAKPTDLNRVSIDLIRMIEESLAASVSDNKTINVVLKKEGPVLVMADEVLLRQVFTNLFINAVDAMPQGGDVNIELNCMRGKVEINIRDTGLGFSSDIKQKIFLPFYTTKEKGIGLGLAIVQKIIVSHGGSIRVDSREGEGTEFLISLPASE